MKIVLVGKYWRNGIMSFFQRIECRMEPVVGLLSSIFTFIAKLRLRSFSISFLAQVHGKRKGKRAEDLILGSWSPFLLIVYGPSNLHFLPEPAGRTKQFLILIDICSVTPPTSHCHWLLSFLFWTPWQRCTWISPSQWRSMDKMWVILPILLLQMRFQEKSMRATQSSKALFIFVLINVTWQIVLPMVLLIVFNSFLIYCLRSRRQVILLLLF